MIQKTCGICGVSFHGYEDRQFCSLKCVHQSMRDAPRACLGCGEIVQMEKKKSLYCNKECEVKSKRLDTPDSPDDFSVYIPLTGGKFALIDQDDIPKVSKHSWYLHKGTTNYARSWVNQDGGRMSLRLHRFILNIDDPKIKVDHIDGNGLDCRKSKLRVVNNSENRMNTFKKTGQTKYKGVAILPDGKFKANIRADNQNHYLGRFVTAEAAARAYDSKARELHGEFGRYNFPELDERSALT